MDTSVDSLSSTQADSLSSTQFESMSGIHQFHMDNARSTIAAILSSLRQTNADLNAARAEIPTEPYERLKWEHCHKDAEPFDFDSIKIPDDYCHIKTCQTLSAIVDQHAFCQNKHYEVLSLSGFDINEHPHAINAFSYLEEDTFKVNKDKLTNHFLLMDMIRSVPLDYIQNNHEEFTKKILTKYIEIYQ
jgi:hypothetical protein